MYITIRNSQFANCELIKSFSLKINIIHLKKRIDRLELLQNELKLQNITDLKIWEGIANQETTIKNISLAHKQIVQYAKAIKLPSILIAEDDIKFTDIGAFDFYLKNIPNDFDLYLGGIIWGHTENDNSVKDFSGTMLYMIHERFYDTFLSVDEHYHIDRGLKNKGRFIVCNPMIAVQHNGFSDNSKRKMIYDVYLKGRDLYKRIYSYKKEN